MKKLSRQTANQTISGDSKGVNNRHACGLIPIEFRKGLQGSLHF